MSSRPDKMIAGVRTVALAAAATLVLVHLNVLARAQAPPDVPTFPSQVELITVDAVVVDGNGRPVPGLTKDDFVLKEDGRVQDIASFEAFVLEPAETPSQPPAVASNEAPARPTNGRAFAILIDDVRIPPARMELARSAVASFLARSVREGDLVMLRTTSGDVSWTARIPDGTEDLLAVVARAKGRDVEPQSIDRMSEYEAFLIANREDAPAMSSGGTLPAGSAAGGAPRAPSEEAPVAGSGLGATRRRVISRWQSALLCIPSNCDSLVRGRAMEIDAARATRQRATLGAVRRELEALALGHVRKALLLLSDGFIEDYSPDLREVAAASRQANTAIHFVNVRGLVALPGFGSAAEATPFALPDPRDQTAMAFEDSVLAAAGAERLADDTGGFSVRNTNDLAGGMERISRESRVFYLLGFYPPEGKSAREWRKLSVDVKRPGLAVRARRGYTLGMPETPRKAARKGKPAAGPDPAIARAVDAPQDLPGIPLRAMAYVLEPRPNDKVHVIVAAELEASRLAPRPGGGSPTARLDVSVVAVGRDTGRGFRHDDVLDLPLRAGAAPEWRSLVREFELPSGVTQVRVVARDTTSGSLGSVSQRFEVPMPGEFRLGTPIVTNRVAPATGPQGRPDVAIAVHRAFPPEGGLYVKFEVFGASRAQGVPRVTAGLEVFAPGSRLVRRVDPSPVAADPDGRIVRQVGLSLDGMEEGAYDLVLNVKDEVKGTALKHREPFVLAREVASR